MIKDKPIVNCGNNGESNRECELHSIVKKHFFHTEVFFIEMPTNLTYLNNLNHLNTHFIC
jgi:hypothetical protein